MRNALLTLILLAILAVDTAANPAGFFGGYVGARRLAAESTVDPVWDGLVAYYALDKSYDAASTITDETGNGVNLTVGATAISSVTIGDYDYSVFNGSSTKATRAVTNNFWGGDSAGSISYWVSVPTHSTVRTIFDIGRSDELGAYLSMPAGGAFRTFGVSHKATAPSSLETLTTTLAANDTVYHVAVVSDGDDYFVYVDGVLKTSGGSGNWIADMSDAGSREINLGYGRNTSGAYQYFSGRTRDLAIHSRALSSNEVYRIATEQLIYRAP